MDNTAEQRYFYVVIPFAYTGALKALTYHAHKQLEPGQIVQITIGRRLVLGIVEHATTRPGFPTKAITAVLDSPPVQDDLRSFAHWLSEYYAASLASVWTTMLPAGLAKERRAKPSASGPVAPAGLPSDPLTPDQSTALARIRNSPLHSHLLQGVTGSGKTRVYLELTQSALAAGRSVIVLVPEITLTPQMVNGFEQAFGGLVLASHSKLTEAKRHQIWDQAQTAAQTGQPRVIIGPRSCLFMPAANLGLVIIDECHETTYKQERSPRYHAIPAAAWRCRYTGAQLILGSATPGLTELYWAQEGKIDHIIMSQRVNKLDLPQAKIIDLRDKDLLKSSKFITQPLLEAITNTITTGRQTLLYLNRRGSASSQICSDCGYVIACPRCRLPLTFHADLMRLVCHHCNFRQTSPAICPQCSGSNLKLLGGGTKRIEAEITRLFPNTRVARLDRDSANLATIHQVLKDLRHGQLDILIGTQMIAKGLDLPAIDTVGVMNADTLLHLPDFSAAERTFQLLTQVAGRAGRGSQPGQVFIQTYSPDHPAITAAATADFDRFSHAELAERQLLGYPPYRFLLKLEVTTTTREAAIEKSTKLVGQLRRLPGLQIAGPAPAFLETSGGGFRWVVTVSATHRPPLVSIAADLTDPAWIADLDPSNLL